MENHQDNESAERWSQQGQQSMLNDAQIVENRHRIDSSDNWSQQVETDELHRMTSMTSSVIMEDSNGSAGIPSDSILSPSCATSTSLAPKREEPTLKEKLVERERQRRVETERARLKLQFALSGGAIDEDSTEQDEIEVSHGSVAGTAGEGSSVAFLDPYDEEGQKLTYPMERFLQEQGGVIEEEPPPRDTSRDNGVVMERFLKEPVVVAENSQQEAILPAHEDGHDRPLNIDRSVSFDMEPNISGDTNTRSTENDTGPIITAMVDRAVADGPQVAELNHELDSEGVVVPTDSMETQTLSAQESQSIGRSDQPRFLRLTEAEIQEMAAIDDASRSNAPPSERDDISDSSFVGELISDFGVTAIDTAGTFSQGTGTTAMESASGDHSNSGRIMSEHEDGHSIDAAGTASLSSHIVSSAGASVAANPPSELGTDDHPLSPIPSMLEGLNHHEASNEDEAMIDDAGPPLTLQEPGPNEARIVNRQIRPGMFNPHRRRQREGLNSAHGLASTPLRRVASAPDLNEFDVDDFDYDKYAQSPASGLFGMEDPPPDDIWSPGSNLSPGKPTYRDRLGSSPPESPVLGARANEYAGVDNTRLNRQLGFRRGTQLRKDPLLPPIPKQVVASPRRNDTSLSTLDRTDAEEYLQSSRFKRAFPQRLFILSITLLVEIPVLLVISGGSDHLHYLLGQSKYQLMMGLIPLSTAISGNVALQSSSLTIRAMNHGLIGRETYATWIFNEVGAAMYLGFAMGAFVSVIALLLSRFHFIFASVVLASQFLSIATASLTGTLTPLLCEYFFEHNGKKWGGAIETAIQDLIGSFVMIAMTYKILEWFGPLDAQASNSCVRSGLV